MLRVHPLGDDVSLEIVSAPAIDAATRDRIRAAWTRAQRGRDEPMFDGKLFSVIERRGSRLLGCFVDYSAFIAQRDEPALRDILNIRSLAVSGILHSPDGIVFGRRANHLAQDSGRWELVPSGGIDGTTLDPSAKILEELTEETGVPATAITESRVVALAEDDATGTIDICIKLGTALTAPELKRLHETTGRAEYTAIDIVPPSVLDDFVATRDIVELSRALLIGRGL